MTAATGLADVETVWLADQWWPALPSSRLKKKPVATRVLDQSLVLFRDRQRQPVAMSDRCPHRGVELSLGRVSDGTIACRYHGWRYDSHGSCVEIPSLPDDGLIPPAAKVCTFDCVETDGYVWVSLSPTPQSSPLRVEAFTRRRWLQGSMPMECDWKKALENNLDWVHPVYAHRWTHPEFYTRLIQGRKEAPYELRITDSGFVMFWLPAARETDPIPQAPKVKITFDLPNRVLVHVQHFPSPFIFQFVPTGSTSCRVEWMFPTHLPKRLSYSPYGGPVLSQDRIVLESAQRNGDIRDVSVKVDTATQMFRRIVKLAVEGEWPAGKSGITPRRVVPAMI